jgi:hypothetical protein
MSLSRQDRGKSFVSHCNTSSITSKHAKPESSRAEHKAFKMKKPSNDESRQESDQGRLMIAKH